ncbi:Glutamine-binding periplasmic protein [Castellaniella defragrans]
MGLIPNGEQPLLLRIIFVNMETLMEIRLRQLRKVLTPFFCGLAFSLASGAASADALDQLLKTKELRVGTEAAMPPLEFVQDGKIVGLGKDILDYIAEKNGFKLVQTNLPWQGVLPGLNAKRFDLVATAVTITPERAKNYAFTIPVDEATTHVVKRKGDNTIKSLSDLEGKVGGTQLGSGTEASVRKWNEAQLKAGKKGLKDLKLYTSFPEAYLALANGEVDVAFHTGTSLKLLVKNRPTIYEMVGKVSDVSYYAWLTRPEDRRLRDFINGHIKELVESGKMRQMQLKWFDDPSNIPLTGYLPEGAL